MNRINILDCTLRDGGYINHFCFGEQVIKNIIKKLSKASIDIIECGFLRSGEFDKDCSLFGSVQDIKRVIGKKNPNLLYVAMIQYGAISEEEIAEYDGTSIDGIRVTFHEHEIEQSFILGKKLIEKGYKVFMQPVGTMTYTDDALLKLIMRVNELKPFGFYLVDTLGTMYKNDLLRMFYLVDHNLDKKIIVGFHSHNNLQLSFANAQELIQLNTPRKLIIDASIFGMGRGAGNLNTELVTQYINSNFGLQYDNLEILEIIDEYIRPLSIQYKWGYDAAYYIASITGCHPNYASYLLNLQTLHVQDIYAILNNLDKEKRALFDKEYISKKYVQYMNHYIDDADVQCQLSKLIGNKPVLLLAPGKSLNENIDKIKQVILSRDYFVLSVNFLPKDIPIDVLFITNMKRFRNLEELHSCLPENINVIISSNITTCESGKNLIINYSSYINEEQNILDNAGLMCINFLKKIGVHEISLAGFDGFSLNATDNYFDKSMYLDVESERIMQMNLSITEKIKQLRTQVNIKFLTDSVYELKKGD